MSLTSYRAAPPRDDVVGLFGRVMKRAFAGRAFFRFGGDLLSHVLGRSTIGAAALNGRVRDGIGCFARAHATKPAKRTGFPRAHETVFPLTFGSMTSAGQGGRSQGNGSACFRIGSSLSGD